MKFVWIACLLALVACGDSTGPGPSRETTFFSYASSPGEYIGAGASHSYSFPDGQWQATFDANGNIEHITVDVNALPGGEYWTFEFSAPPGQPLVVGTYEGARRWPFQGSLPGLSVYGNGRGCNTLAGRFVIKALAIGPGNTVDRFQATFEQNCEEASPILTGEISIAANPWR